MMAGSLQQQISGKPTNSAISVSVQICLLSTLPPGTFSLRQQCLLQLLHAWHAVVATDAAYGSYTRGHQMQHCLMAQALQTVNSILGAALCACSSTSPLEEGPRRPLQPLPHACAGVGNRSTIGNRAP